MVIFGIVFMAFLVVCFFDCLKEAKKYCHYDASRWVLNFIAFGLAGSLLGAVISFALGNFVVPSELVLIETRTLEPVIARGKDVFVIKKGLSYFYFTGNRFSDCPLEVNSVLLEEKDIKFGEEKRVLNKYKEIPKGNLTWFFFSSKGRNELVLLSKDDIL